MYKFCYMILATLLASCSSKIPEQISTLPLQDISISEVQLNPEQFKGLQVRWGGLISKVENQATQTQIEIVSKDLDKGGKPIVDSSSNGRFIANISGFVDPIVYEKGAYVTIVGEVEGISVALIGEYSYSYPVAKVDSVYLWTELNKVEEKEYYPRYRHTYDPWSYRRGPYHSYYR